jgi:hypothetical protein
MSHARFSVEGCAMGDPNLTPWDVYVDERKIPGAYSLGFMVVPNTASFNHKLFRCRHVRIGTNKIFVSREIHWSRFHRGVLRPAMNWIDCFAKHRGAKFYIAAWPAADAKELVILRFLARFVRVKSLCAPYNVAVLLDFDSSHAKARIQNTIRVAGQISRCYHYDSRQNDCLQCCDLLLGCMDSIARDPTMISGFGALYDRWMAGDKLSDSQCKRFIAGYAARAFDASTHKAYDLRVRRKTPTELEG